jgi:integrase
VDLPASVIGELSREGDGYVWTQPAGGPLVHSNWRRRYWLPAVTKAGLAPLRVHDLRHTSVALAIAAGAHPNQIQQQLGHSTVTTTLSVYGHVFPAAARQVAERLETVRAETRKLRAV